MPNRLASEKNPYLKQHKDNPVDWYPWGEEAFQKAKELNRPIFLSIGYATCHWCHVMAHESFEDESIAKLMNEAFINVKVDREERPDLDAIYMVVCQMLTGQGGWPLTIIMTPDKDPFFAGTYIPKEARFNRIGLRQLIPGIKGMWEKEPDKVKKAVERIKEGYQKSLSFEVGNFPGEEAVVYAAEKFAQRFDMEKGGFGDAPKFPSPHNLMFLLRQYHQTKENRFLEMVEKTLVEMRKGGIWDHVGFGLHRYSTDEKWLLPHFEKMLYDQALLMMAYSEAWQITKNDLFKQTVFEISEYLSRNLTDKLGSFYSAEDADSEGEEGKFYVWKSEELKSILSDTEFGFLAKYFNLKEEGNFEDEATKQLTENNILHLNKELNVENGSIYESIRIKLFDSREQRVKPLLDDKILCDWNALMTVAFAKAGRIFNDDSFIEKAEISFQNLVSDFWLDGELYHALRNDEKHITAFADDYAFLIWAALELFESTQNADYIEKAMRLQESFETNYWDVENGGFYFTSTKTEVPLGRQKQIFDGAIPSSNSVTMMNLIKLSRLTGDFKYEEKAQEIGAFFSHDLTRHGSSISYGLQSVQLSMAQANEIVIVEGEDSIEPFKILFNQYFRPFDTLIIKTKKMSSQLEDQSDFLKLMSSVDGKTSVYLCTNQSCNTPFTEISLLEDYLSKNL